MLAKLAAVLKAEAARQEISTREFARRSGGRISWQHVSKLFNGHAHDPSLATILTALAVLGKTLAWLDEAGVAPPDLAKKVKAPRPRATRGSTGSPLPRKAPRA